MLGNKWMNWNCVGVLRRLPLVRPSDGGMSKLIVLIGPSGSVSVTLGRLSLLHCVVNEPWVLRVECFGANRTGCGRATKRWTAKPGPEKLCESICGRLTARLLWIFASEAEHFAGILPRWTGTWTGDVSLDTLLRSVYFHSVLHNFTSKVNKVSQRPSGLWGGFLGADPFIVAQRIMKLRRGPRQHTCRTLSRPFAKQS